MHSRVETRIVQYVLCTLESRREKYSSEPCELYYPVDSTMDSTIHTVHYAAPKTPGNRGLRD